MRYPGGKNAAGTFQTIINQIPPHAVFVELFAGSAAITRHKRPAARTILIDRDGSAINRLKHGVVPSGGDFITGDALNWLSFAPCRSEQITPDWFLYADPPYRHVRNRYLHEFDGQDHCTLLALLIDQPGMAMISGYRTALYNEMLAGWRRLDFQVITRGGSMATESLWMNYPQPTVLHDPRYAGANYRARENLARKKRRWKARIERMPAEERQALLEALTGGLDGAERAALIRNLAATAESAGGDRDAG